MGRNITVLIIFGLGLIGSCSVFAAGAYASINALGRNPSSAPKIFTAMIMALLFAWFLTIITMLIMFQLLSPS